MQPDLVALSDLPGQLPGLPGQLYDGASLGEAEGGGQGASETIGARPLPAPSRSLSWTVPTSSL